MQFQIRTADVDDAGPISDIYNYYVENSTCTFDLEPELLGDRIAWLDAHREKHPAIVCCSEDRVVGWGALSPWHSRPAYQDTAEVSFYVHHEFQGQGIGRLLLAELVQRARLIGHHVLIGCVCTEQAASIKLQESFGLKKVAHFNEVGSKFSRRLDVSYYQLLLNSLDE
jgi:phosphinothricin acetyltransferase